MPLNNQFTARDDGYQGILCLRRRITFDGTGGNASGPTSPFVIGKLPAGALLLPAISGLDINTVFNFGTNNRVQIGVAGTASKYGLNLAAGTLGFVPIAVAVGHRMTADTEILITPDFTGTAGTTGDMSIVIAFSVYNGQ